MRSPAKMIGKPVLKFEGEFDFLSNFFHSPIAFPSARDDVIFPTAEHAFQAAKYKVMLDESTEGRVEYVEKVAAAPTPGKAKYLGRSVRIDQDAWEAQKIDVMREVCKSKFLQHPDLMERLLLTDGLLVETNDHRDVEWGRCDGRGKNLLGVVLMEIRGWRRIDLENH